MADYGLKRNGSGYRDETAYRAFMSMAKPGDVWTAGDGHKKVLILKNQGAYCNCLTLIDTHKHDRMMEIRSALVYHTDPAMLEYLFCDKLGAFVERLPADEFDRVLEEVEAALYFGRKGADKGHRKECHELLDKILDRVGAK